MHTEDTMKISIDEAIEILEEMVEYVKKADVRIGKKKFEIKNGILLDANNASEEKEIIYSAEPKEVEDITIFLEKFIKLSRALEKNTCMRMWLYTPDPDWSWEIRARYFCCTAMVMYVNNKDSNIYDPEKDKEKLFQLGFKLSNPGPVMNLK